MFLTTFKFLKCKKFSVLENFSDNHCRKSFNFHLLETFAKIL